MTAVGFSIVVPTRNRPQALRRLLDAVAMQNYPRERYEVIVVDDGGKTPLTNLEDEYGSRLRLSVIRQTSAGCGPARQTGADQAHERYLLFTDDDCSPAPDWLASMARVLDCNPDCGVGGSTVNGLEEDLFAETTQFIVGLLTLQGRDDAGRIRYCPTSNVAFPAAAFRSVGGLDRRWSNSGGEDRDLCARWLAAGFTLRYEPAAVVRHFHPLTAGGFIRQHFRYGRGAWRFHRSSGPREMESPGFYRKLITEPFREYPMSKAVRLVLAVLLAQVATAAGLLVEAAQRMGRRV